VRDKGRPVQRHPDMVVDSDRRDLDVASSGSLTGIVSGQMAIHVADTDPHTQYILADGTRAMSGNLDMAGHEALDMVIHTVADATEKAALVPVEGKLAYQSDTKSFYICTEIA